MCCEHLQHLLSNRWRCFSLIPLCFFYLHVFFWSCSALSSLGTIVSPINNFYFSSLFQLYFSYCAGYVMLLQHSYLSIVTFYDLYFSLMQLSCECIANGISPYYLQFLFLTFATLFLVIVILFHKFISCCCNFLSRSCDFVTILTLFLFISHLWLSQFCNFISCHCDFISHCCDYFSQLQINFIQLQLFHTFETLYLTIVNLYCTSRSSIFCDHFIVLQLYSISCIWQKV